jgi:hypothetical protein
MTDEKIMQETRETRLRRLIHPKRPMIINGPHVLISQKILGLLWTSDDEEQITNGDKYRNFI